MKNSREMVEILILRGSFLNAKDLKFVNIILLFLIRIIYNQTRKLNKKNFTPLHWAASNNRKEIGNLLISNGANIHEKDINLLNKTLFLLINII